MYSAAQPGVQLGDEETPAFANAIAEGVRGNRARARQALQGARVEIEKSGSFASFNKRFYDNRFAAHLLDETVWRGEI